MNGGRSSIVVAVTFPKQEMYILYEKTRMAHPLAYLKGAVHSERSNGSRLIRLSGVPAWAVPDTSGRSSWGMIQFIDGGAMIQVTGHTDLASLRAVAQSIVDRTKVAA